VLLAVSPLLIAFLLFQRQFAQSFMRSGIKCGEISVLPKGLQSEPTVAATVALAAAKSLCYHRNGDIVMKRAEASK
jgi:hypothetical protein